MARTKGAKNKPKGPGVMRIENMDDVISPEKAGKWLNVSRAEIIRQIHAKEIPEDCYFMIGDHYKIITRRLGEVKGIVPPQNRVGLPEDFVNQLAGAMQEIARAEVVKMFNIPSILPENVVQLRSSAQNGR